LPDALLIGVGFRPLLCQIRFLKGLQTGWEIGMMSKLRSVTVGRSVSSSFVELVEKPEE
jgi:hypothetical protein